MSSGHDVNWFCFRTLLHFVSICTMSTPNVTVIFVTFRVDLANAKCNKNQNVTIITLVLFVLYHTANMTLRHCL